MYALTSLVWLVLIQFKPIWDILYVLNVASFVIYSPGGATIFSAFLVRKNWVLGEMGLNRAKCLRAKGQGSGLTEVTTDNQHHRPLVARTGHRHISADR